MGRQSRTTASLGRLAVLLSALALLPLTGCSDSNDPADITAIEWAALAAVGQADDYCRRIQFEGDDADAARAEFRAELQERRTELSDEDLDWIVGAFDERCAAVTD